MADDDNKPPAPAATTKPSKRLGSISQPVRGFRSLNSNARPQTQPTTPAAAAAASAATTSPTQGQTRGTFRPSKSAGRRAGTAAAGRGRGAAAGATTGGASPRGRAAQLGAADVVAPDNVAVHARDRAHAEDEAWKASKTDKLLESDAMDLLLLLHEAREVREDRIARCIKKNVRPRTYNDLVASRESRAQRSEQLSPGRAAGASGSAGGGRGSGSRKGSAGRGGAEASATALLPPAPPPPRRGARAGGGGSKAASSMPGIKTERDGLPVIPPPPSLGPVDDHDNNGNFDDDEDMVPIPPPPPSDKKKESKKTKLDPAQLLEWDEAPNAQEADAPKARTYPSTVPMHKLESLHDMPPRGVRPSIDDPAHRLHISTDDAPGADGTPAFLLHIPAFAMVEMEAQRRAASASSGPPSAEAFDAGEPPGGVRLEGMRLDVHKSGKVTMWLDQCCFDITPSLIEQTSAQDLVLFTNAARGEAATAADIAGQTVGEGRIYGAIDIRASAEFNVEHALAFEDAQRDDDMMDM